MKKVLLSLAILMAMGSSVSASCVWDCYDSCIKGGGKPSTCTYQCKKECGVY